MVSAVISRLAIVVFGTLYPAYRSYKAVASKDVKEYVKWMMYWISFAVFSCAEMLADIFVSFWMPFYYELKILLIFWLLSPYTRGASYLYRKTIHPTLQKHEKDIDAYLDRFRKSSYSTMVQLGNRGINYARDAVAQVAIKSQAQLVQQIRKAQSMSDITEGPEIMEVDDAQAEDFLAQQSSSHTQRIVVSRPTSQVYPRIPVDNGQQPPLIEEEYSDDEQESEQDYQRSTSEGPAIEVTQPEMEEEDFDLADYGHPPPQPQTSAARQIRTRTRGKPASGGAKGSAGMSAQEKDAYAYGTLPRTTRSGMKRPPLHMED